MPRCDKNESEEEEEENRRVIVSSISGTLGGGWVAEEGKREITVAMNNGIWWEEAYSDCGI